jgi:hypothetical protein
MMIVEFPGNGQQEAISFLVLGVEVREHMLVARFPQGRTLVIADHVGVAGWRIRNAGPARMSRTFPRFIVKIQAA